MLEPEAVVCGGDLVVSGYEDGTLSLQTADGVDLVEALRPQHDLEAGVCGLALGEGAEVLYVLRVADYVDVYRINPGEADPIELQRHIGFPDGVRSIASAGDRLYVALADGRIVMRRGTTESPVANVGRERVHHLAASADGRVAWLQQPSRGARWYRDDGAAELPRCRARVSVRLPSGRMRSVELQGVVTAVAFGQDVRGGLPLPPN